MHTLEQLQQSLLEKYKEVDEGRLDLKVADTLANVAGKAIAISKVQIEYYALRKEKPVLEAVASSIPPTTPAIPAAKPRRLKTT